MALLRRGHDRVLHKVLVYTQGLDRSTFAADAMRYEATLRNLESIGEAATHVPSYARQQPMFPGA